MPVELSQQIIYYNINQIINVYIWVSVHFCPHDDFVPIKLNDTNRRRILWRVSCAKYLQRRYSFRCESRNYLLGINCVIKLCTSAVHIWSHWDHRVNNKKLYCLIKLIRISERKLEKRKTAGGKNLVFFSFRVCIVNFSIKRRVELFLWNCINFATTRQKHFFPVSQRQSEVLYSGF